MIAQTVFPVTADGTHKQVTIVNQGLWMWTQHNAGLRGARSAVKLKGTKLLESHPNRAVSCKALLDFATIGEQL